MFDEDYVDNDFLDDGNLHLTYFIDYGDSYQEPKNKQPATALNS